MGRFFQSSHPETTEIRPGYRHVSERAVVGHPVGNPVMAKDPEKDTLTYHLYKGDRPAAIAGVVQSMDEDYFTIDQATGQLYLAVPTPLDYDVDRAKLMHPKREYTVTVLATDPFYGPLDVIPGVGRTGVAGTTTLTEGTTFDADLVELPDLPSSVTDRRSFDWIDITVYVVPVDENPSIPLNIPADTNLETGVEFLLEAEE